MQWDFTHRSTLPLELEEATAYSRLVERLDAPPLPTSVEVTGPPLKTTGGFVLQIRVFTA